MRSSRLGSEIKRLYEEGLGDHEISYRLDVSIWTVRYWRRKYKLRPNPPQKTCQLCGEVFRGFDKAKYCTKCRDICCYR